jgi:hypothetical protein
MSQVPHKCPVCDGAGVVSYPPGTVAGQSFTTSETGPWVCHVCNGTCLVWSPEPVITNWPTPGTLTPPWYPAGTIIDYPSEPADPHAGCFPGRPCSTTCPGQGYTGEFVIGDVPDPDPLIDDPHFGCGPNERCPVGCPKGGYRVDYNTMFADRPDQWLNLTGSQESIMTAVQKQVQQEIMKTVPVTRSRLETTNDTGPVLILAVDDDRVFKVYPDGTSWPCAVGRRLWDHAADKNEIPEEWMKK